MKLCKDCKWCEFDTFAKCDNPNNLIYNNLISGTNIVRRKYIYCSTQREFNWLSARILGVCGKKGRWYERSNL